MEPQGNGTARASMNGRIAGIYFCPQLLGF
jgi:hypothetical protein